MSAFFRPNHCNRGLQTSNNVGDSIGFFITFAPRRCFNYQSQLLCKSFKTQRRLVASPN